MDNRQIFISESSTDKFRPLVMFCFLLSTHKYKTMLLRRSSPYTYNTALEEFCLLDFFLINYPLGIAQFIIKFPPSRSPSIHITNALLFNHFAKDFGEFRSMSYFIVFLHLPYATCDTPDIAINT